MAKKVVALAAERWIFGISALCIDRLVCRDPFPGQEDQKCRVCLVMSGITGGELLAHG